MECLIIFRNIITPVYTRNKAIFVRISVTKKRYYLHQAQSVLEGCQRSLSLRYSISIFLLITRTLRNDKGLAWFSQDLFALSIRLERFSCFSPKSFPILTHLPCFITYILTFRTYFFKIDQ